MTTLGPYSLIRRIGAGGMGEVWIARREAIGGAAKLVAIKTVLPEKAEHPEARRMFLDEARLSMLMTNSNIVQVFDVGESDDGTCYMVMEYVEGIDLARLCEIFRTRGEHLSHSVIAYIIGEILKALAYAHDLKSGGVHHTIIHRDISPQNVMISTSGEVKVMDFGVARLSSEETSGTFVKGKLRYMPPEQFTRSSHAPAPTLDLFPVGAILHELLDGQRFRGSGFDETEMIGMCVQGFVPPLACAPERVPAVFEQLRKGLLEPVAADRIQSARAAHRLLSRWPGSRDAKFELEDIALRVVGESLVVAPVSTLAAEDDATLISNGAQARGASGSASNAAATAELISDSVELATSPTQQRAIPPSPTVTVTSFEVLDASGRATLRTADSTRRLVLVLAGVGMGLGAISLVAMLGQPVNPKPAEAPHAAASEPVASRQQPFVNGPVPSSAAPAPAVTATASEAISPTADPPAADPPAADPPPPNAVPAQSEPAIVSPEPKIKPQKKPNKVKATVVISVAAVWAQVKIGHKVHTIDRLKGTSQAHARLPPGSHDVSFRDVASGDWQSLDKLVVVEGEHVNLDIKAGKATVRK